MLSRTSSSISTSSFVSSTLSPKIKEISTQLISAITQTLEKLIDKNSSLSSRCSRYKIFNNKTLPEISIHDYIERIYKYTEISISTLIISLIYTDRFCDNTNILLTNYNIHRVIFCAVLASIKFNEDNVFSLKFYAEVAGVKLEELRNLEEAFFNGTKGSLYVDVKEYEMYHRYLKNYIYKD